MYQPSLFGGSIAVEVPETEVIKYAGSKLKLIPYIFYLSKKVNTHTVLDGFSGTTRVSQAFAKSVFEDYRKGENNVYVAVSAMERLLREVNAK